MHDVTCTRHVFAVSYAGRTAGTERVHISIKRQYVGRRRRRRGVSSGRAIHPVCYRRRSRHDKTAFRGGRRKSATHGGTARRGFGGRLTRTRLGSVLKPTRTARRGAPNCFARTTAVFAMTITAERSRKNAPWSCVTRRSERPDNSPGGSGHRWFRERRKNQTNTRRRFVVTDKTSSPRFVSVYVVFSRRRRSPASSHGSYIRSERTRRTRGRRRADARTESVKTFVFSSGATSIAQHRTSFFSSGPRLFGSPTVCVREN